MAYRNGTYIAFHADGKEDPSESDMKYYNTLRMWKARDDNDFTFINSHEKRNVRDSSSKETLKRVLQQRLNNSKHLVLIIGNTTRNDTDWVPMEIIHAVDNCNIPIIAAYTGYSKIQAPDQLRHLWPKALTERIDNGTAKVIHVPFKRDPILDAVNRFDFNNLPSGPFVYYNTTAYQSWGLL